MNGKQIRVYLVDGTPGGLLTAEIMNWTGHVVAAPRSDIANLLARDEVRSTGVYLLIGDDPDSLSPAHTTKNPEIRGRRPSEPPPEYSRLNSRRGPRTRTTG